MQKSIFPLIMTAFCTAIVAVMAQITIPLPLIPITGQTLAIGLVVTILGKKYGTLAISLYVLLGAIGLPVFQGFTGGFSILIGPTGGYIVGFIPTAYIIGYYLECSHFSRFHATVSNLIGMLITLFFGAIWLKFYTETTWTIAFTSGIAPFLLIGIVKAFIAAYLGVTIRQRLFEAKLLQKLT